MYGRVAAVGIFLGGVCLASWYVQTHERPLSPPELAPPVASRKPENDPVLPGQAWVPLAVRKQRLRFAPEGLKIRTSFDALECDENGYLWLDGSCWAYPRNSTGLSVVAERYSGGWHIQVPPGRLKQLSADKLTHYEGRYQPVLEVVETDEQP